MGVKHTNRAAGHPVSPTSVMGIFYAPAPSNGPCKCRTSTPKATELACRCNLPVMSGAASRFQSLLMRRKFLKLIPKKLFRRLLFWCLVLRRPCFVPCGFVRGFEFGTSAGEWPRGCWLFVLFRCSPGSSVLASSCRHSSQFPIPAPVPVPHTARGLITENNKKREVSKVRVSIPHIFRCCCCA